MNESGSGFPKGCWIALAVAGGCAVLAVIGLVVLGIFLAVIVAPSIEESVVMAQDKQIRVEMEAIETACEAYYLSNGVYPESPEDLLDPEKGGPFIEELVPDPWGNPYILEIGEEGALHVISLGADGERGGEGEARDRDSADEEPDYVPLDSDTSED